MGNGSFHIELYRNLIFRQPFPSESLSHALRWNGSFRPGLYADLGEGGFEVAEGRFPFCFRGKWKSQAILCRSGNDGSKMAPHNSLRVCISLPYLWGKDTQFNGLAEHIRDQLTSRFLAQDGRVWQKKCDVGAIFEVATIKASIYQIYMHLVWRVPIKLFSSRESYEREWATYVLDLHTVDSWNSFRRCRMKKIPSCLYVANYSGLIFPALP